MAITRVKKFFEASVPRSEESSARGITNFWVCNDLYSLAEILRDDKFTALKTGESK